MANDYLPLNLSAPRAPQLRQRVDLLLMARDGLIDIANTVGHMNDGTTFTTIEQQYGLPVNSGPNFASLITGVVNALNAPIVQEFLARLG